MGRRNKEEEKIQLDFIVWCWNNHNRWKDVEIEIPRRVRFGRKTIEVMAKSVPFFHVPNGGNRDAVTGSKLNAHGLRKGMLDLVLPVPAGKHCGLIVEVKKPKGVVSKEQKIWLTFLERVGWRVEVCRSIAECIDVATTYLNSR